MSDIAADIKELQTKATLLTLQVGMFKERCRAILQDAESIAERIVIQAPAIKPQIDEAMKALRQSGEALGITHAPGSCP